MADWFTIDKTSGSGDGNVIITASSNEELMEKIAKLRVTTLNGRTKDVSVREKAFKTDPSTLIFPYKNTETQSLHIYCSNGWTISKPDWVLVSSTSGQGDGFISVNVEDNEDLYREGVITITASNGMVRTISVAQAEMEHHTISVSPDMLEFGYKGGDFTINIVTDYEWIAVPPAGVTLSQYSGVGNAVVTGTKDKNESEDVYSGVIVFSTDTDSASVMIAQSGKPSPEGIWIEVTPSSYKFSEMGETITITMRTNSEDWGMLEPTFGEAEMLEERKEYGVIIATISLAINKLPSSIVERDGSLMFLCVIDDEIVKRETFTFTQSRNPYKVPFYIKNYSLGQEAGFTLDGNECVLEYSFNAKDWFPVVPYEGITFTNRLYLRGDNDIIDTNFIMNNGLDKTARTDVIIGGNIMYLLDKNGVAKEMGENCFNGIFAFNDNLRSAKDLLLPATTLSDGCYWSMFMRCTGLRFAPELPATNLSTNCYKYMFSGCTNLEEAPELPATTLAPYCYQGMFEYTHRLLLGVGYTITLPAMELAEGCYANMFNGSSGVLNLHNFSLPATTLAQHCYDGMFSNCKKLTTADFDLPSTQLTEYCYARMFYGCSNLYVVLSILPATTLAEGCYDSMYYETDIIEAPELPATEIAPNCYNEMFRNCERLRDIKCYALTPFKLESGYCYDWVNNVNGSGVFYKKASTEYELGSSGIPRGWEIRSLSPSSTLSVTPSDIVEVESEGGEENIVYYDIESNTNWYIDALEDRITIVGGSTGSGNARRGFILQKNEYPTTIGMQIVFRTTDGERVVSRIISQKGGEATRETLFTLISEGSSTLLWNRQVTENTLEYSYDLYDWRTLEPNTEIEFGTIFLRGDNERLNKFSLTYSNIFTIGGDNVSVAGNIMFLLDKNGNDKTLPSGCFGGLFKGCTKIIYADNLVLPSYTSAECYKQMFSDCTNLVTAPKLPATTLANDCYYMMFYRCRNLIVAPELPATTLASHCYWFMFTYCNKLNTVRIASITALSSSYSTDWVDGVSSTGTFYKKEGVSHPSGKDGVPTGWTIVNY